MRKTRDGFAGFVSPRISSLQEHGRARLAREAWDSSENPGDSGGSDVERRAVASLSFPLASFLV
jgi:hypothetical protein